MITIYPYENLGTADYGWLKARYHFSFAHYLNRHRMGFGALRVINDDIIGPNRGFDTHPHNDMEIITFVRSGAITHGDSKGNKGRTEAGDVQVMSAGTGIAHSESNQEDVETTLYQIWIIPHTKGVEPQWGQAVFSKEPVHDHLNLLVSGRPEDAESGALFINQYAAIYGGTMSKGTKITHNLKSQAYILISQGAATLNGADIKKGDGAEITDESSVEIEALDDTEIIIIEVPA
jgi:redox-sensitive bicupin YhaK (pirin superfamily)